MFGYIGVQHLHLQESGLLKGRSYTARALTEGGTVKHRFVGHFRLANGLEVYQRSFNVFNLTLWDDIIEEFGDLTDEDVLVSSLPSLLSEELNASNHLFRALLAGLVSTSHGHWHRGSSAHAYTLEHCALSSVASMGGVLVCLSWSFTS